MPTRPHRVPKYRHYTPKNLAVVRIDGHDHYLGTYDSPESHERYHRLIAEWLAADRSSPPTSDHRPASIDVTINSLVLAYWRHAEGHYRGVNGEPTQELENMRDAIRPLRKLYGSTQATDFGPLALRSIQQEMVRSGLCRTTINARINRIRRVFKWAVGVEMAPPSVHQALQAVSGLQKGRTDAREPTEIKPVPIEHVEATLPHLNRVVAAMVRLQLLTACRTEEVLSVRGCDLTPGEPNWEFHPDQHKTEWRGKERVIPLGPRAQEIIKGFLKPDLQSCLFSPQDVVEELHARRAQQRKSRPTPSERSRRVQGTPGQHHHGGYDRRAYRQAIIRACRRAGVPRWTPLQLKHTAATAIRARYGLEASQVVLGHAKADVTQIYAERDLAKAHAVMAEIG